MNAIVQAGQFGAVSTRFANQKVENELGAGIQGGFGMIGYKGKVWSIRKGGEEHQLMRDDGDGPRNSIEVVVVGAPKVISKVFYAGGYVEGSTAAPDCYSTNGTTPAAGVAPDKKRSPVCASCPMNAWGSRVTPAGKQGKACSDSKRLAVVPLGDLRNEAFGGPLLLRVPAASLTEMATFGAAMAQRGYPLISFGLRISFDPAESYPKFKFAAIRPLSDEEADIVLELKESPAVARILAEDEFEQAAQQQPVQQVQAPLFEQEQPKTQGVAPSGPTSGGFKTAPMNPQSQPTTGAASSTPAQPAVGNSPVQITGVAHATGTLPVSASAETQAGEQKPSVGSVASVQSAIGGTDSVPTGLVDFDAALDEMLADQ